MSIKSSSYFAFYLLFICTGKVAKIQTIFPDGTDQYRCHCPSIILRCNFPTAPRIVAANWFVKVNRFPENCADVDGHMVNAANLQRGMLILSICDTGQLPGSIYNCIAVYSDSSTAERVFTIPQSEGQLFILL